MDQRLAEQKSRSGLLEFSFGEEPREGDRVKRRRFLAHRHTYGLLRTILQSCLFAFTISELSSPSSLVNTYTFSLIHFIFSVFWATMRAAEIEFLGSVQQIWASHFDLAAAGDLNGMVDMFWTTDSRAGGLVASGNGQLDSGIPIFAAGRNFFLVPTGAQDPSMQQDSSRFCLDRDDSPGFFAGTFSQAQAMGCSNCIFGS